MQFLISGVTLLPKSHADAHDFKQLPLTLYTTNRITATGYSKVSRYTIHASRHSIDKVLRYLKRVIVTPAVYQLFTPLKRSLKYWHWADITFYTQRYRLAES